jgi:hypothetical protein
MKSKITQSIQNVVSKLRSPIHPCIKESMDTKEIIAQVIASIYGMEDTMYSDRLVFELDEAVEAELGKGYVVRTYNEFRHDIERLAHLNPGV